MKTNTDSRLLFTGFIILLVVNLCLIFYLFRPVNTNEITKLNKIQQRLDSLSQRMETSRIRIDTVLANIKHSLDLSRQLDEQVIELSTGYEKDKALARKKLDRLKEDIRKEHEKLELLQHELKQL